MDVTGDGLRRIHVDAIAAQVATGIRAATIRVWAHRGHVTRIGRDRRGRVLYDLDEILRHAGRAGLDTGGHEV